MIYFPFQVRELPGTHVGGGLKIDVRPLHACVFACALHMISVNIYIYIYYIYIYIKGERERERFANACVWRCRSVCEQKLEQVRELPGTHVVGWLKIDVRPLRHSLLTCVSRWREVVQVVILRRGGKSGANRKSISLKCYLREVACKWESTK